MFRDKIAAMRHLFRSCDEVAFDFGEADRCFDVIRAVNYAARYREAYEKDPNSLGPNVRANYEMAAGMTLADVAWAHLEQTRIFRRFQQTFRDYDLVLAPTTPVSPFPWSQLYLAEMDGKPLRNYYHWLSLTYVITLVTNPAISIPAASTTRACRSAAGRRAVPRRPRGARRGARAGAGVRRDRRAAPSRARPGQAHAADARAQIDRDASAHPRLQVALPLDLEAGGTRIYVNLTERTDPVEPSA